MSFGDNINNGAIEILDEVRIKVGFIRKFSKAHDLGEDDLKMYINWRLNMAEFFFSQTQINIEGTKNWLLNTFSNQNSAMLFFIFDLNMKKIGYVSINDIKEGFSCEIGNVLRGVKTEKPIIYFALKAIISLISLNFNIKLFTLDVFSDNQKAIALYKRLGFIEESQTPLKLITLENGTRWEKASKPEEDCKRYSSHMVLNYK